jgi:hypothetical protein
VSRRQPLPRDSDGRMFTNSRCRYGGLADGSAVDARTTDSRCPRIKLRFTKPLYTPMSQYDIPFRQRSYGILRFQQNLSSVTCGGWPAGAPCLYYSPYVEEPLCKKSTILYIRISQYHGWQPHDETLTMAKRPLPTQKVLQD